MRRESRPGYKLIFVRSITTRSGRKIFASWYGKKAFAIWVKV